MAQKTSENTVNDAMSNFVLKMMARGEEKSMKILRLQRELDNAQSMLNLLKIENDAKEEEIKSLKEEIKTLNHKLSDAGLSTKELAKANVTKKKLLKKKEEEIESLKKEIETLKKKKLKFNDVVVIFPQNNIVASPSAEKRDIASSSKVESTEGKVNSSEANTVVNKKLIKRAKEIHVPSYSYNLRERQKKTYNLRVRGVGTMLCN